ncbi:sensor histidine kinase [Candidatus Solirubrobacter pratensis]|uniref:sensor histidine kinase n=1 Tax=Candidatus Solirubrobacter pratensis TaxID=1298857 RepID=UPI00040B36B9|nr:GAF domain-containing protein [Candidatus Solirubrobacter pratensis]
MKSEDPLRADLEQNALRRVAALVATSATPAELFAAVADEVARALPVAAVALGRYEPGGAVTVLATSNAPGFAVGDRWPREHRGLAARIVDTGRAARSDDDPAPDSATGSMVGVPITVEGAVWGLICAGATDVEGLPADTDVRLQAFTELIAVAIASAESRDRLRGLADRQAALRRVATLVAEGAPAAELFAAVTQEIVRVLGVPTVSLLRYDPDGAGTVVASLNSPEFPVGSRWPLDGPSLSATILETGRPARIDDYAKLPGTLAAAVRQTGLRSGAGVPIVVDAKAWGALCVGARGNDPPPADVEARLSEFTELVGIAVSNAESRERRRRLADQQAALRRVATLAAEGAAPDELLAAVAEEVARILDVTSVTVVRYEPGREWVVVASLDDPDLPVGSRRPLDAPPGCFAAVFETGHPAQLESGAAVPIVVDGDVWGAVAVTRRRRREALPVFAGSYTGRIVLSTASTQDIEARLAAFTEIAAAALSKAQANDDLRRLAEEQAALRRVATLVARTVPPEDIFAAVADEVARILGLPRIEMVRYEDDGTATVVAASGDPPFPVGSRWALDGPSVMALVRRTGRPGRIDDYGELGGTIAEITRGAGFRSAIGAPMIVGGRTWGAIIALSALPEPIPEHSAVRLSQFTELVATAVSNATARAELVASRARIVAAGDDARRRFERDLHDGTQQRLIALRLDLQRIRAAIAEDPQAAQAGLGEAERDLESVLEEVRKVSRGLHPAQLSRGGLRPSLKALAGKSPISVDVDVEIEERPPAPVETGVYYVVSEALTNAIKHSRASAISVTVARDEARVRATVADDGVGGAVAGTGAGTGLTGLSDRVAALGGRISVESPPGRGTRISVELPIATPAAP